MATFLVDLAITCPCDAWDRMVDKDVAIKPNTQESALGLGGFEHTPVLTSGIINCCRLVSTGDPSDVSRPLYGHAICLSIGYLAVAWCWLVLSSEPIVNRLAVLLSIYAIILGALAWTMNKDLARAWMGIALISMPGCCFCRCRPLHAFEVTCCGRIRSRDQPVVA